MKPQRPLRVTADDTRRLDDIFKPVAGEVAPTPPPGRLGPAHQETFPGYIQPREVARGTFIAKPRDGGDSVVIRVLPVRSFGDSRHLQRYSANMDKTVQLAVPGVVPVRARGTALDGRPFVVRDHVHGVPLDVYARGEAFNLESPPPLSAVVSQFARVARIVHETHVAGVLHGGLKPTNVIVDPSGTPRVTDFGLNLVAGGETADDVAGLGRLYFDVLRSRTTPPDSALTAIVSRAMNRGTTQAYPSALAIAEDLEHYLTGKPATGQPLGVREGILAWFVKHLKTPAAAPIVGVICGLIVGLFFLFAAHSVAAQPLSEMPYAFVPTIALSGTTFTMWFGAVIVATLSAGGIAARLARPRTKVGTLVCGVLAGASFGFIAWLTGFGGYLNTFVAAGRVEPLQWLAAEFPVRPAFTGISSFDIESAHAQDRLLERYPDLATIPEADRGPAIANRLLDGVRIGSMAGAWLTPTLPLALGIGLALLGSLAVRGVHGMRASWPARLWIYLELSLPGQLGLLLLMIVTARAAAGFGLGSWYVPPAVFVLAGAIALAIRVRVLAVARAAIYLAGIAFLLRTAGAALPWWTEIPAFAAGLIAILSHASRPAPLVVSVDA